ncbi:hypothetical protein DFJ69_5655 [Thermomonospora umbrina]|uniref:Uncharacterized protein n=1 Tax=Thermomonospora umbrina TaxID=111806 RepID=A0A3D9SW07_9ACTN|nr:hypothetical protein DFJ69_5655 [Thermomonospora umbrina]
MSTPEPVTEPRSWPPAARAASARPKPGPHPWRARDPKRKHGAGRRRRVTAGLRDRCPHPSRARNPGHGHPPRERPAPLQSPAPTPGEHETRSASTLRGVTGERPPSFHGRSHGRAGHGTRITTARPRVLGERPPPLLGRSPRPSRARDPDHGRTTRCPGAAGPLPSRSRLQGERGNPTTAGRLGASERAADALPSRSRVQAERDTITTDGASQAGGRRPSMATSRPSRTRNTSRDHVARDGPQPVPARSVAPQGRARKPDHGRVSRRRTRTAVALPRVRCSSDVLSGQGPDHVSPSRRIGACGPVSLPPGPCALVRDGGGRGTKCRHRRYAERPVGVARSS